MHTAAKGGDLLISVSTLCFDQACAGTFLWLDEFLEKARSACCRYSGS
jgi:hypothetical protein